MPGMRPRKMPISVPRAIGAAESLTSWRVSIALLISGSATRICLRSRFTRISARP